MIRAVPHCFRWLLPLLLPALLVAQQPAAPSGLLPDDTVAALNAARAGTIAPEHFPALLPHLGSPGVRERLGEALAKMNEFPRRALVDLLSHRELAVRLGALELLEEAAGGDFGYTPWVDPTSEEIKAAIEQWQRWAGESGPVSSGARLSDDQRQSALREILGGDPDKSARARRLLESDGLRSLEFLETHLANTPSLPEAARVRIRAAEYQIVLARRFGPQAEMLARDLTTGTRDQTLSALTTIRGAGLDCLPILRDFLPHPDPLVRESAMDSWLVTGRVSVVGTAAPLLAAETDVNVIHGALRRLKDLPGNESISLATGFVTHPDEDVAVSALQTCQTLSGGNQRSYGQQQKKIVPESLRLAVLKLLDDPRWRVRTAALEFVGAMVMSGAEDKVLALLGDADTFVRFAAIKAAGALSLKTAVAPLRDLFFSDPSMIGPVVEGYGSLSQPLDDEMFTLLRKSTVDVRIGALRAMESHGDAFAKQVLALAADSDPDVACTALRQLVSDYERLSDPDVQQVVLAVVRARDPARTAAVFERLTLPSNERLQPLQADPLQGTPTSLDPLYEAFLKPLAAMLKETGGEPGVSNPVVNAAIQEANDPASPYAWHAAKALADRGWPQAWGPLVRWLPELTTAQKVEAADVQYAPSGPDCVRFLTALLADPVQEVRETAAATMLEHGSKVPQFVDMVLPALERGQPISPAAIVGYQLRDTMNAADKARVLHPWIMRQLQDTDAPPPLRVFAMMLLELAPFPSADPHLAEIGRHGESLLLRRAAWHALAAHPGGLAGHINAIASDAEASVRLVLPAVYSEPHSAWVYQFDSLSSTPKPWYDNRAAPVPSPEALEALRSHAERDPSPIVRFEAQFTLLMHNQPVEIEPFLSLLARQTKESGARRRMTDWLEANPGNARPALRPLLAMIDHEAISANDYATLLRRMGSDSAAFQTFGELAKTAATEPAAHAAPDQPAAVTTEEPAPARTSLPVLFFHKPGCEECRRARELLASMKSSFPGLEVTEANIMEAASTLLNQALCARFSVPSAHHTVTPALFSQAGFSIRDDISPATVGALLQRTTRLPQDDSWMTVSREETTAAAREVERRYESLTLGVVVLAGLLDGINPCAFATIILFLSWLQIARRTSREMLLTGAAFILAVFIAYLSAGLVLYKVLEGLSRFTWIQKWMNYVFAAFALLAAFLSFRDAALASRGRMDQMTLQLPGFLKSRIRDSIRAGAKARRFIIAAFVTGLVVSLLELACTGQVYAPIIYQIQQGRGGAVLWLLAYNLAFILPLVIIFLATWLGLRSEHLMAFQKKHTGTVKCALGFLFIVLALLILFSDRLLH